MPDSDSLLDSDPLLDKVESIVESTLGPLLAPELRLVKEYRNRLHDYWWTKRIFSVIPDKIVSLFNNREDIVFHSIWEVSPPSGLAIQEGLKKRRKALLWSEFILSQNQKTIKFHYNRRNYTILNAKFTEAKNLKALEKRLRDRVSIITEFFSRPGYKEVLAWGVERAKSSAPLLVEAIDCLKAINPKATEKWKFSPYIRLEEGPKKASAEIYASDLFRLNTIFTSTYKGSELELNSAGQFYFTISDSILGDPRILSWLKNYLSSRQGNGKISEIIKTNIDRLTPNQRSITSQITNSWEEGSLKNEVNLHFTVTYLNHKPQIFMDFTIDAKTPSYEMPQAITEIERRTNLISDMMNLGVALSRLHPLETLLTSGS